MALQVQYASPGVAVETLFYVQFFVPGQPIPKGSKRAIARPGCRPVIIEDNKRTKPWAKAIRYKALQAMADRSFEMSTESVEVSIIFWLSRPKGLSRKVSAMTKKPDIDKLVRNVLDALTGVVYRDDALVVRLVVEKSYADGSLYTGALVRVRSFLGLRLGHAQVTQ